MFVCFLSIFVYASFGVLSKVKKDQQTLTKFFEELLLEHGGAYTLLGSKPATIEDLIDISPDSYQKLQEYLAAHPEIPKLEVERYLEEGWEILKYKQIKFSDRFILTEVKQGDNKLLVFLNVDLTIKSMKDNYAEFKRVSGFDFDPMEEIANLRSGKHDLWRKVFDDFICQGILLGYGRKNAKCFQNLYSERVRGNLQEFKPSENNDPRIKAECYLNEIPFRLPIFVMFDEIESKELIEKYKTERDEIKKVYFGKNFLDVTLDILRIYPYKSVS